VRESEQQQSEAAARRRLLRQQMEGQHGRHRGGFELVEAKQAKVAATIEVSRSRWCYAGSPAFAQSVTS